MDEEEFMERQKMDDLQQKIRDSAEASEEPNLSGEQIGLLAVVIGLSGLGGVYASTLFESLIQQLLGGLSATVLIFGVLVIASHLFFGDSE